jgi:hypothetical protein
MNPFTFLRNAVILLAYDNGCVNRFETEESVVSKAMDALYAHWTIQELDKADQELAAFTPEQFEDVIVGEHDPSKCSKLLDDILNMAFDNL